MIDRAMIMYKISEEHILRHWSLETLVKKLDSGYGFELLKLGYSPKKKAVEERALSDTEITRLYA